MIVTPLKTRRVEPNALSLTALLDEAITELAEGSIVAITSKIVSLCEGSVVPRDEMSKESLISQEASRYMDPAASKYGITFSVTNHTLIPTAGIDESNGADQYVLWPRDPQTAAREARSHLAWQFGLQDVGVIITDSTCQPLRRGTSGIAIAHAGFKGLKDYIGQRDLFGNDYRVTMSNLAGGLASAAVVTMGEGTEQTPLCVLSDLPFITFGASYPDDDELKTMRISPEEDLFAPFLQAVDWQSGEGRATPG